MEQQKKKRGDGAFTLVGHTDGFDAYFARFPPHCGIRVRMMLVSPGAALQWFTAMLKAVEWCRAEYGNEYQGGLFLPASLITIHDHSYMTELEFAGLVGKGVYEGTEYVLFQPTAADFDRAIAQDVSKSVE